MSKKLWRETVAGAFTSSYKQTLTLFRHHEVSLLYHRGQLKTGWINEWTSAIMPLFVYKHLVFKSQRKNDKRKGQHVKWSLQYHLQYFSFIFIVPKTDYTNNVICKMIHKRKTLLFDKALKSESSILSQFLSWYSTWVKYTLIPFFIFHSWISWTFVYDTASKYMYFA